MRPTENIFDVDYGRHFLLRRLKNEMRHDWNPCFLNAPFMARNAAITDVNGHQQKLSRSAA